MGRIHRYRTAWRRHRRSKGFGIHSPYAFNFVLNVLRERLPYYNYAYLKQLRQAVIKETSGMGKRHPRVMSYKNAKMLFRVANFFNPELIFQAGTNYGYSSASLLSCSTLSRLHLYEPALERFPVVANVLQPFLDDIETYNELDVALNCYKNELGERKPFVLINSINNDSEYDKLLCYVKAVLNNEGVVILRNISKNDYMKRFWFDCKSSAIHGHTYSNEKLAIIVSRAQLPLQHFLLWF